MRLCFPAALFAAMICFVAAASAQDTGAIPVTLDHTGDGGWTLMRQAQPYFIQGAGGGEGSWRLLKDIGGNSVRLWGADHIETQMQRAQSLGLTVAVGIWLEHEGPHFSYKNADDCQKNLDRVRDAVTKYRDWPNTLIWGIGNEMEGYQQGDDPAIWANVEACAKLAKQLDPNHPTMTVIAEIGGQRVQSIEKYCPDIDIIGINSYAGGPSLAQRYRAMNPTRPFIVTEFGAPGQWEVGKTAWGAPIEPTSTAKAATYRATYEKTVLAEKGKLCLGSYAFDWGHKEEATATWHGMFLPDGDKTASVDVMEELWTGREPQDPCPEVQPLMVDHQQVAPGERVHAHLQVTDPKGNPVHVHWELTPDPANYMTAGEFQADVSPIHSAIVQSSSHGATVEMPRQAGGYWLYAFVTDGKGAGAVADTPLRVSSTQTPGDQSQPPASSGGESTGASAAPTASPKATLPLIVYGKGSTNPYIPSGWMGDTGSIALNPNCTDNPHNGGVCLECQYKAAGSFGGVVWQNPANNWGDQPGGFNLTGATKLTFWARGADGGENVQFKMGILGADKKYPDSSESDLTVSLTKDWKQYTIDLSGKDLSSIKTGFCWVVAGAGKPIKFYLDDIKYE